MGGGLDLIDRLKRAEPLDRLVALSGIPDLRRISVSEGALWIGATVTHEMLMSDPLVAERLPGVQEIWRQVANPRVRAVGTIGGNLMAGIRHYDAAPAFFALGADALIQLPSGDFDRMPLEDALRRDNVLLHALVVPASAPVRLLADRSLHPLVSVYASELAYGARIAVGCAYERPVVFAMSRDERVDDKLATLPAPINVDGTSAAYRRRMIGVLVRRVLARL